MAISGDGASSSLLDRFRQALEACEQIKSEPPTPELVDGTLAAPATLGPQATPLRSTTVPSAGDLPGRTLVSPPSSFTPFSAVAPPPPVPPQYFVFKSEGAQLVSAASPAEPPVSIGTLAPRWTSRARCAFWLFFVVLTAGVLAAMRRYWRSWRDACAEARDSVRHTLHFPRRRASTATLADPEDSGLEEAEAPPPLPPPLPLRGPRRAGNTTAPPPPPTRRNEGLRVPKRVLFLDADKAQRATPHVEEVPDDDLASQVLHVPAAAAARDTPAASGAPEADVEAAERGAAPQATADGADPLFYPL